LSFVADRALYGQKTQSRACVGERLPLEDGAMDGRNAQIAVIATTVAP
jgi:hypothetical protein